MQGLWKQNVSGVYKDSKRKKTKFKHIIKDNIDVHLKRFYNKKRLDNSISEEIKTEEISFVIDLHSEFVPYGYLYFNNIKIFCFLDNNQFFNFNSLLKLDLIIIRRIPFSFNFVCLIEGKEILCTFKKEDYFKNPFFDNKKIVTKENVVLRTGKLFFYKKLFNDRIYSVYRRYRKKSSCKIISGSNRTYLRNWILSGNFEKEIKEHECTKSVKRLIL